MKKIVAVFVLFVLTLIPFAHFAHAQIASFPFGGKVATVTFCNDGSTLIYEVDLIYKSLIPIVYTPYVSAIRSWYNVWTPGNWVAGTAFYGGVCTIGNTVIPALGTVTGPLPLMPGIGSSLVPSL